MGASGVSGAADARPAAGAFQGASKAPSGMQPHGRVRRVLVGHSLGAAGAAAEAIANPEVRARSGVTVGLHASRFKAADFTQMTISQRAGRAMGV